MTYQENISFNNIDWYTISWNNIDFNAFSSSVKDCSSIEELKAIIFDKYPNCNLQVLTKFRK